MTTSGEILTRRDLFKTGALATAAATLPLASPHDAAARRPTPESQAQTAVKCGGTNALQSRSMIMILDHPYWCEARGMTGTIKAFFDQAGWEVKLRGLAENGYNAILYSCEPMQVHQWQTWLIPYKDHPEWRDLTAEQAEAVVNHLTWLFGKAKELGMQNYLINMCIVTTQSFAKVHGLDKNMPLSDTVDWRHNYEHKIPGGINYEKMIHWGVRNEQTRQFAEDSIAELFQTYPDLDGLIGTLGEALPGRRSTWYKEAIVPGLKRSGRKPAFILFHWMLPLEECLNDVTSKEIYDNTWIAIEHNGEIFSDVEPYPISLRWAKIGTPIIMQYVGHNVGPLPVNSPRFAYEMIRSARKVDNIAGFSYYCDAGTLQLTDHELFGKALGYYGENDEPYSDEPWVKILEERFGDREAAQHFVKAYNASGWITPGMNQLAWSPHDGRCTHQLMLKYWHWTGQDLLMSHYVSPPMGDILLPMRHYAEVVARLGPQFRDNDGSKIFAPGSSGAQEMIWSHIDFQVTPEMHMREIRRMGGEALREAEAAMRTVKKNQDQATRVLNQMKAYKLLTEYYEKKVLAAIAALIYTYGGKAEDKAEAERLGDETVTLYTVAANHIYETLDNKSGNMKGGWWDEQKDLPGLIEVERRDRAEMAKQFKWPGGESQMGSPNSDEGKAKLGTTRQVK